MARKRAKIHKPYQEIKGWLRTNSLKYEDVARLLGCTIGTVSDKVNGYSDFYMCEIDKIIATFPNASYKKFFPESC